MAYQINDQCNACGDCVQICPNDAITPINRSYRIELRLCTECLGYASEPQCAFLCPRKAVVLAEVFPLGEERNSRFLH